MSVGKFQSFVEIYQWKVDNNTKLTASVDDTITFVFGIDKSAKGSVS